LDYLAVATAEALAKIGTSALSALIEAVKSPEPRVRIYGYAALGWINDSRSYQVLVEAVRQDSELADIAATALTDHDNPSTESRLYEAYQRCPPAQRFSFEDAIYDLHWKHRPLAFLNMDWRLRYRSDPILGIIQPPWPVFASVLWQRRQKLDAAEIFPLRPLEEVVKYRAGREKPQDLCEHCGKENEYPTGIPVCSESALTIALTQNALLQSYREDGFDDLFELLDEIEKRSSDARGRPEPKSKTQAERLNDREADLAIGHQTCRWLIEQGIENVGAAKAFLLAQTAWLADRYGDPKELLQPVKPATRTQPKIGRNELCSCGSGKKFKRCCLGKVP